MALPAMLGLPFLFGLGARAAPHVGRALGFAQKSGSLKHPISGSRLGDTQNFLAASLLGLPAAQYGVGKYQQRGIKKDTAAKTLTGYPEHASGALPSFNKSMETSVNKAADELGDEDDDPFNYNQLFIASILKGMKQKPPAQSSGKIAGSYIPKPDLPKMSDYDTNKTYWNIG